MRFSELATGFLRYKAARGASPRSADCWGLTFGQFTAYLRARGLEDDVRSFTPETVEGFVGYLAEHGLKASSIGVKLAGLSSLGRYGTRVKDGRGRYVLAENPVARVERPKPSAPPERYLYPNEIRAILDVEAPANERLALRFLFETQLRASAAAGARVRDLSIEPTAEGDRLRLTVREKGDHPDTFLLSPELGDALLASLRSREAGPDEPLLVNAAGRAYTRTSLSEMVARLARRAGVTRVPVRAHLFARHSPASLAGQAGASVFEVAAMLRHRDLSTAKRYVHGVNADAVRARVRDLLEAARPPASP